MKNIFFLAGILYFLESQNKKDQQIKKYNIFIISSWVVILGCDLSLI